MKKNIIYCCFDKNYLKLFKYLYYSLKNNNYEGKILCITDESLDLSAFDVEQWKVKNLDTKYTAKYIIIDWNKFENYDNYLYLDTDVIAIKKIDELFEEIQKDENNFHAAQEVKSLNNANQYFNFDKRKFNEDTPAFNAGIFGFNKKQKNEINQFLNFINNNKEKAIHDQPLFNIFFYKKIKNSFGEHIEMFDYYKPVETKIIHFMGSGKEKQYKRFFRKETRGEILHLLPTISKVGLFNCGEYFEKEQIKYMREKREKIIDVVKNNYHVEDEYYDLIYIDAASSINEIIETIRKLYKKIKKGGVIASITGNENNKKILKEFITKSNLDYYQCFEDDVFFTIKL